VPGLAGDIAPAMRDTLGQGDASPGPRLEEFLSDLDAVATREDHKMLILTAIKMHRGDTTGAAVDYQVYLLDAVTMSVMLLASPLQ
jgi:hypothetical protein